MSGKGKDQKKVKLDFGPPIDPLRPLFSLATDPNQEPERWAQEYSEHETKLLQPVLPDGSTSVFDLRSLRRLREDLRERRRRRRPEGGSVQRPVSAPLPVQQPSPVQQQPSGTLLVRSGSALGSRSQSPGPELFPGVTRKRLPPPASLRAPASPVRPARSPVAASPGRCAAPLPLSAVSPRQGDMSLIPTDDELEALISCAVPQPEYAELVKVDCSFTDLSWLASSRPRQPSSLCTLYSLRDEPRPGPLNSPRSVLTALRAGISPAQLKRPSLAQFSGPAIAKEDAMRRFQHCEQRRELVLDMLLEEYRNVCAVFPMSSITEFAAARCGNSNQQQHRAQSTEDQAAPTFVHDRRQKAKKQITAGKEFVKRRVRMGMAADQAAFEAETRRMKELQDAEEDAKRRQQQAIANREHALRQREQRMADMDRIRAAREDLKWQKHAMLEEKYTERSRHVSAMAQQQREQRAARLLDRQDRWKRSCLRGVALEQAKRDRWLQRQHQKEAAAELRIREEEARRLPGQEAQMRRERREQRREAAARFDELKRNKLLTQNDEQEQEIASRHEARLADTSRQRCEEELLQDDKRFYVARQARAKHFREACLLGAVRRKEIRIRRAANMRDEIEAELRCAREQQRQEQEHLLAEIQVRAQHRKVLSPSPARPSPA
eukprot:TRINITY_DN14196_c0_g1_i2.p1 TRINITY_DN14196_c0_g1~~TRINITY_DN14196_c0_g1_i2.p1  ORF type:complete len:664 (+),score=91.27 TRINITY_DN14196_c0_g1_i2:74-2065(+)